VNTRKQPAYVRSTTYQGQTDYASVYSQVCVLPSYVIFITMHIKYYWNKHHIPKKFYLLSKAKECKRKVLFLYHTALLPFRSCTVYLDWASLRRSNKKYGWWLSKVKLYAYSDWCAWWLEVKPLLQRCLISAGNIRHAGNGTYSEFWQ